MRALIQRVSEASVKVDDEILGRIDNGLLVLLGVEKEDSEEDSDWLIKKIINMRIFSDQDGKMNNSLLDVSGHLLIVSQFTLHASTKKGNRPSFIKAATPALAKSMYERFIHDCRQFVSKVETGQFAADMKVTLINDGPVTIWIDSKNRE
jgi:D-tyrosyl-tRNA(Tyr) deacylase